MLGTAAVLASGSLLANGQTRPAAAGWFAVVTADELNLRSEPGDWAEAIGTLWGGEWVEVLDGPSAGNWWWVAAGDRAGWADGAYLSADGAATSEAVVEIGRDDGWAERWVDINRSNQTVSLFEGESVLASSWAALGWDGSDDGFFATAIGSWSVYEMNAELAWTDYGGAFITDWVGFDPGRSNGFHSYLKDGNGLLIPGGDGPTGGCVALEPGASAQLFAFASIGTRVEVHW